MKPSEECASIQDVRLGIDTLDREVIALIGRRKAMLEARRRWAEEEGLSPG